MPANSVHWLDAPEDHDYDAGLEYLSLIDDPENGRSAEVIEALRQATEIYYFAKDVLRAAQLALLPQSNAHVRKDLEKIHANKPLSPVLLLRGYRITNEPLIIVDGYHRVCSAYHVDENAPISCRIVS
jgi:hypothetical protein